MYKQLFLLFMYFNNTLQYSINPNNFANKIFINKNINQNINKNFNRINDIKCLETNELCNIIDNVLQYKLVDDITIGKIVVEQISALLPRVDSIGHNILSANDKFILYILNNPNLSEELQKKIILSSIKLAQSGDNFGSTILQLYYDIVEKSL